MAWMWHNHGDNYVTGAEAAGYPTVTHGVFQRGGVDLVFHFYADANKQMAEHLTLERQAVEEGALE